MKYVGGLLPLMSVWSICWALNSNGFLWRGFWGCRYIKIAMLFFLVLLIINFNLGLLPKCTWKSSVYFQNPHENHGSCPHNPRHTQNPTTCLSLLSLIAFLEKKNRGERLSAVGLFRRMSLIERSIKNLPLIWKTMFFHPYWKLQKILGLFWNLDAYYFFKRPNLKERYLD